MSHVGDLWEHLVQAALRREIIGTDVYGCPIGGIAGNVPSSLANNRDIDEILRVAYEIQDEDPNVASYWWKTTFSTSGTPIGYDGAGGGHGGRVMEVRGTSDEYPFGGNGGGRVKLLLKDLLYINGSITAECEDGGSTGGGG
ncbi:hypothetical protein FNV43_RR09652 [Rhamnella rubrinervis]|uniref:Uncharacterized protein n=1 Tax=Rhamnella rubrinervis TaxID=2594499 RepID=A0A8K0HBN5_9ROSA|nr:hypothetical protein FNV43_RR09652 [Rhamnella rubrinervis]